MAEQNPIISFLREQEILDETTLQSVIERKQKTEQSLISILKNDNLLDEDRLTEVVAAANKIEFINLSPDMVDPIVAHLVSYDLANQHNAVPIRKDGDSLIVAMSSPLNLSVRDQIEMKTGYKVAPVAATPRAIRQVIHHHFDVANVTRQAIASMRLREDSHKGSRRDALDQEKAETSDDPITKLVSSIIRGAIDAGASDIHIEPQEGDVRVRYRTDGILRRAVDVPASAQLEVASHIKIMADMDISERRVPQDGHMAVQHGGIEYDLRVSSLPAVGGEKIVIRILDKNAKKWSLDAVVTRPEDNRKFRELISNPYGIILLTGPTGSGKTTTLYSVLQLLNDPRRNIVTVEDPVEYRLDGITQVQIKPVAGLTFGSALRSILRQDPDIILIGEIRDLETAEIAVSAASTGHLVLSTLHTNDAAGAISRLINIGVPPYLVGSTLLGAVAQRLIGTSCTNCKQRYEPPEEELRFVFGDSHINKDVQFQHGTGCSSCHESGYRGRKSIYEILSISPAVRRLILDGANEDAIKQQAIEEGMTTLRESAVKEVLDGVTTLDELMRAVDVRR